MNNLKVSGVCWTTTVDCNMKCPICYAYYNNKDINPIISTKEKFLIIDRLVDEFELKKISFGGGEPLLTKDIFELIQYAKLKGLKVALHTNGKLLGREKLQRLNNILDELSIPLDGAYAEQHALHRSDNKHYEEILSLLEIVKSYNIKTDISTVVTKKNVSKLKDIFLILKKHSVYKWKVFRFYPLGRGYVNSKEFFLTEDEFLKNTLFLKSSDDSIQVDIRNSNARTMRSYINITPNGEISMICGSSYKSFGRILQLNDISKVLLREDFNFDGHQIRHWREK
ncbi:radical SAM protein [Desulfosediminicola ganghwensis]|uniref:radical SAM protein n=1 Tax=Desulfosediminicola ganghwensis TaxID=2569540 RepID=UPI0010AD651A|nr:radical SAM protein [Desulfosediminicola ganghwensis]